MKLRTTKDVYVALLIELNKHKSPTILLEDFNYFHQKAIQSYVNKRVNIYPVGRQVVDDLQPLMKFNYPLVKQAENNTFPISTRFALPNDYFHLQRCNIALTVLQDDLSRCFYKNAVVYPDVRPITSKELSSINSNYYFKPSLTRAYYMVNQDGLNYKLDIFCGELTTKTISNVYVDYLHAPKVVTLTEDDIYAEEDVMDTSDTLQFKEYVNQEIFNELLTMILENNSDPRLQTAAQINQSIAPPVIQTK